MNDKAKAIETLQKEIPKPTPKQAKRIAELFSAKHLKLHPTQAMVVPMADGTVALALIREHSFAALAKSAGMAGSKADELTTTEVLAVVSIDASMAVPLANQLSVAGMQQQSAIMRPPSSIITDSGGGFDPKAGMN